MDQVRKKRRLKIVSDGNFIGTRVIDAETGEEIGGVTGVTWRHELGDYPRATIEVWGVAADVDGLYETTSLQDDARESEEPRAHLSVDQNGIWLHEQANVTFVGKPANTEQLLIVAADHLDITPEHVALLKTGVMTAADVFRLYGVPEGVTRGQARS
jgi:hypothetical protein